MLPLPSVVQAVSTWWSPMVTLMGLSGAKPLPLTAAPLPAGPPSAGVRLMDALTVYVALVEYPPSDTVTLWVPTVVSGTVNPQGGKLPLRSVLQSVETLWSSKVTVTVSFFLKPLPVTVARSPTEPSFEGISTDGLTLK